MPELDDLGSLVPLAGADLSALDKIAVYHAATKSVREVSAVEVGSGTTESVLALLADEMPIVYALAIGQSNMQRGNGGGTYGQTAYDIDNNSKVQILTTAGAWATYDMDVPRLTTGLGDQRAEATANVATIPYYFAKELSRKNGTAVRVIGAAKDSQSLTYWGPTGTGSGFNTAAEGWQSIVTQLALVPRIDVVLFHQGETLDGRSQAQQLSDLKLLFTRLRDTGKVTADTPIIAGDFVSPTATGNLALNELELDATWPQFRMARRPDGAPMVDGIHFTDEQIRLFGYEYCRVYRENVVKTRELYNGDSHLGRFQTSFASSNQPRYRLPLTQSAGSGASGYGKFRVQLIQGLSGGRNAVEFDVGVNLSGNGGVWTAFVIGGGSNGAMGASVSVENTTTTYGELVIHFVNPTAGSSFWAGSVMFVRDILPYTEAAELANDFVVGALTSETESNAAYQAGGSARDMVTVAAGSDIDPVSSKLTAAYGTAYKKYRLTVTEATGGKSMLCKFRFEAQAIEVSSIGGRGVCADLLISRWGGHNERNIGVSGTKTGLGIKCTIENETAAAFDILIRLCYPVGTDANLQLDAKCGIIRGIGFDTTYADFLAGNISFTFAQEAEADSLYQPGGAGVADF